jgi:hypothetical protein
MKSFDVITIASMINERFGMKFTTESRSSFSIIHVRYSTMLYCRWAIL